MRGWINRRTAGAAIALALLIGLGYAYRARAATARFEGAKALAAQVRDLPEGQGQELRDKLRAALDRLPPDQRRKVLGQGFEESMAAYFKLSKADRLAYLDKMIRRGRNWGPGGNGANRGTNTGAGNGANRGAANAGGNPPNANRPAQTADQRAATRRERLDQSTPEQRAMRSEFFKDMQARRAQLGLPPMGRNRGA